MESSWNSINMKYHIYRNGEQISGCQGLRRYGEESEVAGIYVFPILNSPPSSLPIPFLWVIPVHQPQASSIVHRTWTELKINLYLGPWWLRPLSWSKNLNKIAYFFLEICFHPAISKEYSEFNIIDKISYILAKDD